MREYIKKCIREEVQLTIATLIKIRQKDWQDYYDDKMLNEAKSEFGNDEDLYLELLREFK